MNARTKPASLRGEYHKIYDMSAKRINMLKSFVKNDK